jgi:aspartate-semialdehyde dehydrogenase
MKPAARGQRVAVIGASSLLGKELISVLEERKFPVSRLVTFEDEEDEQALPIVDLTEHSQVIVADEDVHEGELDFAFVAASATASRPAFLQRALQPQNGRQPAAAHHCVVIDLDGSLAGTGSQVSRVPSLDRMERRDGSSARPETARPEVIVAPHSATIVISSLLLPLSEVVPLKRAVAHAFMPASEIGPRAIEELQKQTINLLSFQKAPQAVFGAQIAFNMLPRVGRSTQPIVQHQEERIRKQLRQYLGERAPLPALRLLQAPVFYSLALSLYVETSRSVAVEKLRQALVGKRVRMRRSSEQAPSPVEVTGSSDILLDAITADGEHPTGVWIWAAVDNLRLAAENAVEIAESLIPLTDGLTGRS